MIGNLKPCGIRIDIELLKRLKDEAAEKNTKYQSLMRDILWEHYKAKDKLAEEEETCHTSTQ